MNTITPKHAALIFRSLCALAFAGALKVPVQAIPGHPVVAEEKGKDNEKDKTEKKMNECCEELKQQKKKMAEDIRAQNAELAEQIATMNNAPEDKKMGLMAEILTRLVGQKSVMDARREKMEEDMMKHMMQHMQMGPDSAGKCPMMKDMKDMKEKKEPAKKPGDAPKGHQH
jgi:hypothetical protein